MSNKLRLAVLTSSLFSASVLANITIGNVGFDSNTVIPNPGSANFNINYYLFGSQIFNPGGQVEFFLTKDGGATGYYVGREAPNLNCASNGCRPINTQNTFKVSPFNIDPTTKAYLSSLCLPTDFQVVARFNNSVSVSHNTASFGTVGKPDWLFHSGSMTPANISTGYAGNLKVTFVVKNDGCPNSPVLPKVGVFLADANNNALAYFGAVQVLNDVGSQHEVLLPMRNLNLAKGSYRIVLMADVERKVNETNENNNFGAFTLNVTDPAVQSDQEAIYYYQRNANLDNSPEQSGYGLEELSYSITEEQSLKVVKEQALKQQD
ncbi:MULTISPECIES: hypothetical protein [Pseudoalteromonas]|uniref:CARDB domain-containing protein n=1 Tax=Pseudoalteromonas luteoviolacea (strain 2ta16) TaxID=1353533 RepID=V4HY54_PSEL2|nr:MULTISPECIES: hypothetical protein [Pseudoalteromonas]ESP94748.1 hypothetical protein PL2TA16_00748 [Pseudoalteromonas luteoviolacea 2ta16]KZN43387.1 hypothetical protein N483_08825 [Pseudoalteromonas luteoviolacea NCIMB 1944]MCG7547425.1 hypothetical protein [Pseudoalteromonas sp. Of7M-16]